MQIPTSVTRAFGNTSLKLQKNSPHIYFAGGLIGVLTGTVLACRSTLKLPATVEVIEEEIHAVKSNQGVMHKTEYSRELVAVYISSAVKVSKLYAPAALILSVSIAALAKSHVDMNRRNTALAAAYAGISQMFEEYRDRIRSEIGEERENEIYLNARKVTTVDENGKKVKALEVDGLPNQTARFFDSSNPNWKPDASWNRYFLMSQQAYANDRLHALGHVTLNDIYDWLGFDRIPEGQLFGWSTKGEGPHYIDFGLNDSLNVQKSNILEWSTLLDFNVDNEVVWDKI